MRESLGVYLRDRRFWVVQILVFTIAAGHIALESGGSLLGWPQLYLIPASLFFIPAIYAGLVFGKVGAVFTSLLCWALSAPSIVLLHGPAEQVGVNLQLAIMLVAALLVGRSVDREKRTHAQLLGINAQLRELNATALAVTSSLDVTKILTRVVRLLLGSRRADVAWCVVEPADRGSPVTVSLQGASGHAGELPDACRAVSRAVLETGASATSQGMAVVPIMVEGGVAGALGVSGSRAMGTDSDTDQLEAVGRQLGLALGNIFHLDASRLAVRDLARSEAELLTYVQRVADAQEEERRRLARELHDETIQSLVLARVDLEESSRSWGARGVDLAPIVSALDHTIAGVRRICRDLRPSILDDLGLSQALEALAGDLETRTGITADLDVEDAVPRLPASTELGLFRIAQEAVHNIERHARARRVAITLRVGPEETLLRVTDDGCGFDCESVGPGEDQVDGLGIRGMTERTRAMGGSLVIRSAPGGGTVVEARGPVVAPSS